MTSPPPSTACHVCKRPLLDQERTATLHPWTEERAHYPCLLSLFKRDGRLVILTKSEKAPS